MEPVTITLEERSALIKQMPWAENLNDSQVEQFARFLMANKYDANEVVFSEGDSADFLGLVHEGRLQVLKEDMDNVSQSIAFLNAGETFGEMALIDGEPRSATLKTMEPSTLLMLNEQNFNNMMEEFPRVALAILRAIAKMLSKRLRDTSGWLVEAFSKEMTDLQNGDE